ncbi:type II toxin-antitoxin system death-on-curing family toxin [uncultured Amnibacterium sp.]|uniref:type II toxin-antitoxin system death-on-curing family toxin n=1 Tax=uncultured Amnibacterium sp. TaxID=1631851 RepID=UPI0035CA4CDF
MIFLTLEELLHVAERTLGAPARLRDAGLLESALARPRTTVAGVDAYPGIEDKAAALVHSLVRNHGLIDGNKRLGLVGLIVFLAVNGLELQFSNDEAFDFITDIAEGRLDEVGAIATRIRFATVATG